MIDRGRPNLFLQRRTWVGALLLAVAIAFAAALMNRTEWLSLAILPPALVSIGFVAVLVTAGVLGTSPRYPLNKVSECCPWCRIERPVRYRCPSCGTWHDDLRPGFHGLWHVRCGVCKAELATTDRGGRAAYARSCGNAECGHELPDPIGRLPEYHIALVGREAHLLVPMLRRLEEQYLAPNRITLRFLDAEEERAYRAGEHPRRLTAIVTMPTGQSSLLFLSDLTTAGPTQRFLAIARLDGLMFVVDPPASASRSDVPGPGGRRFALTTAVLVRTPDVAAGLPAHDLAGAFVNVAATVQEAERDSSQVREFLARRGLETFMHSVERRFQRVGHFALPGGESASGLATPLGWLLGRVGALSDASPAGRSLAHLATYCRRVWHGDEGEVLAGCWLGVYFILAMFVLFACVWSCLGRWFFFAVLVAGAAGLWWALYRQLRPRREGPG